MAIYSTVADSEIDPESPGTTTLFAKLRDNPLAMFEKTVGAPVLANDYIVADMIPDGEVTDAKLESVSVGNYCIMAGAISKTSAALTYPSVEKIAEIIVGRQSAMRVRFTSTVTGATGATYWRLYKNGAYQSAQDYCSGDSDTETSFDITGLVSGDLVQIYLYPSAGTSTATGTLANLRICYDKPIDGGSLYF